MTPSPYRSRIRPLSGTWKSALYDGDTIRQYKASLHGPYGMALAPVMNRFRFHGIDTPEMRPKKKGRSKASIDREKKRAYQARDLVLEMMLENPIVLWDPTRRDPIWYEPGSEDMGKYGGLLGKPYAITSNNTERDIIQALIDAGLAVEYDGGTKAEDWGAA